MFSCYQGDFSFTFYQVKSPFIFISWVGTSSTTALPPGGAKSCTGDNAAKLTPPSDSGTDGQFVSLYQWPPPTVTGLGQEKFVARTLAPGPFQTHTLDISPPFQGCFWHPTLGAGLEMLL